MNCPNCHEEMARIPQFDVECGSERIEMYWCGGCAISVGLHYYNGSRVTGALTGANGGPLGPMDEPDESTDDDSWFGWVEPIPID